MLQRLLLVRHGESAGNVARDRAIAQNLPFIDIAERDCDVTLSPAGELQAAALGRRLSGEQPEPHVVFSSPYVRARRTAEIMMESASWPAPLRVDERLREKEFGMLDRLTRSGIEARFPDQAQMRRRLGKFYYRPPGGESWADVVLRLRSAFELLLRAYSGKNVLIVSHQVVVLCMRYIIEDLDERRLLQIDAAGDVANCSLTAYEYAPAAPNGMRLVCYNETAPLENEGAPVTAKADAPAGPK